MAEDHYWNGSSGGGADWRKPQRGAGGQGHRGGGAYADGGGSGYTNGGGRWGSGGTGHYSGGDSYPDGSGTGGGCGNAGNSATTSGGDRPRYKPPGAAGWTPNQLTAGRRQGGSDEAASRGFGGVAATPPSRGLGSGGGAAADTSWAPSLNAVHRETPPRSVGAQGKSWQNHSSWESHGSWQDWGYSDSTPAAPRQDWGYSDSTPGASRQDWGYSGSTSAAPTKNGDETKRGRSGKGGAAESGKPSRDGGRTHSKASGQEEGKAPGRSKDEGGKSSGKRREENGKGKTKTAKGRGDDLDEEADEETAKPAARRKTAGTGAVTDSHLSTDRFADLPVSAESRRALQSGFGYEYMTMVQASTIHPLLEGRDIVARAKTGTGKTLAFLVPIVELIKGNAGGIGGPISALILSPTRELADQIANEAKVLLEFHKRLGVACFYGGVNIKGDKDALAKKPCDILVATPGRMTDHLQNTAGFQKRLERLVFLTLDEADQLLDMGFRDVIVAIIKSLPPVGRRQGALFSATFPTSVSEIAKLALRSNYEMIDTVRPEEEVTPDQIKQCVVCTDIENMMESLWSAVSHEKNRVKNYKIMVFFVTARLTQFYSEQFCAAGCEVLEIHSRKTQNHRNKCAEQFRQGDRGIIFSSDVLARGLDMPDVSAVIQVGVPSSRDQYIHRLGRTGRAGKAGCCTLLLHDFEQYFLKVVKDLPVKNMTAAAAFPQASTPPDALWWPPDQKTGAQAYQAWLGYYNSAKGLGWPKDKLVKEATRFAYSICMVGDDGLPPPILKKTVGQMGLKGVQGLNIVSQLPFKE